MTFEEKVKKYRKLYLKAQTVEALKVYLTDEFLQQESQRASRSVIATDFGDVPQEIISEVVKDLTDFIERLESRMAGLNKEKKGTKRATG